jgi:hypothetical protein
MSKKKQKKKARITNRQDKTPKKEIQIRQTDIKYQKLMTKTNSMLNELGLSTESTAFIEPPDEAKMSEVIFKLADPLLKTCGDDDKLIKTIIALTIGVWNKLMFPDDEQGKIEDEMIDYIVPKSGDAEDVGVLVYINDLITERKNRYFPNLRRAIFSYDLTVSRGNVALNITSAPIKLDAKSK